MRSFDSFDTRFSPFTPWLGCNHALIVSLNPPSLLRHYPHYSNHSFLLSFFSSLSLKSLISFPSSTYLLTCTSTPSSLVLAPERHHGTISPFNPRHFTTTQQSSVTTPPYLTTTFFLLDDPFLYSYNALTRFPKSRSAHQRTLHLYHPHTETSWSGIKSCI